MNPFKKATVVLALLIFPLSVFAQTTGKISGQVTDAETDQLLPGTNIIIEGTSMGASANEDGHYVILNVPPGLYTIKASFIGYAPYTVKNVQVSAGLTKFQDFALRPQALQQGEVVVTAERPIIEPSATNKTYVTRSEDISSMPIRSVNEVVGVQAGVVQSGGNLHVRGGRAENVAYYVDGVYQVNPYNGRNAAQVSTNALEEISYQAGGFNAEFGDATAGIINTTTKTGGSKFQFHGEAITDEFMGSGGDPFAYSYGYNLYNMSLSGPLLTDNIRFYVNGERRWEEDRNRYAAAHPVINNLDEISRIINKIDYHNYSDGPLEVSGSQGDTVFTEDNTARNPLETAFMLTEGGYDNFEMQNGALPHNSGSDWLYSGNVVFDFKPIIFRIGYNGSQRTNFNYDHGFSLMSPQSGSKMVNINDAVYGKITHTLGQWTAYDLTVSYFRDGYERGAPNIMNGEDVKYTDSAGNKKSWSAGMLIPDSTTVDGEKVPVPDNDAIYDQTYDYRFVAYGDTSVNPALPDQGGFVPARSWAAIFDNPGAVYNDYDKNLSEYLGVSGNFIRQQNQHELKFGFNYRKNTIRYYRVGSPRRLADSWEDLYTETQFMDDDSTADLLTTLRDLASKGILDTTASGQPIRDYGKYTDYRKRQDYRNAYVENIGYDLLGNETDSGIDGPRTPVVAGAFLQDKIEYNDLILNLGLRLDYFDTGTKQFLHPDNIVLNENLTVAERVYVQGYTTNDQGDTTGTKYTYSPTPLDSEGKKQLEPGDTYTIVSPRIGFAFPVTDRTVFHAQYGNFVQHPELQRMYISYARFESNLSQGNFTTSGNPNLEPVETTQYELGFTQQFGQVASLDLTAFYKQVTGQVQLRNVQPSDAANHSIYATYVNGDYATIKGFSSTFDLRRVNRLRAKLSYTLQWAGGTGSTANGQYRIAWQGGNYPTFTNPMDYDQRHTGSMLVDYRFGENDGPVLFGTRPMSLSGMNILASFGSGQRYTPIEVQSYWGGISDNPIAALNSGTMPWSFKVDMKLDKTFNAGPVNLNAYVWIINLLNRRNVREVFAATGLAGEDGYLATEEAKQTYLQNFTNEEFGQELYRARISEPNDWAAPRQVRFGIQVDL